MKPNIRAIGMAGATALVVGNMIGSGVFLLPASLAPFGGTTLIAWTVTLLGALAIAATFARLAMRWPASGGPYVFARNAFGDLAGFVVGWSYWVSMWCALSAIAVAFGGSVVALFPALAGGLWPALLAVGVIVLVTAINLVGVREASFAQLVLTVLKVLPLLLFGGVALWFIEPSRFVPLNPTTQPLPLAVHAAVALTLWSLLGLESATVPADDIIDPQRTVPRATVWGTLIAGIATVLACVAVQGVVPADVLAQSPAPMSEAAHRLWGPLAGKFMAVVAAVSCLGALNGWALLSAQLPMAAAKDGLMPPLFLRTDARGTPVAGLLVGGTLATLLVIANYSGSLVSLFTFAILLSTAATLLPYVAGCLAWLVKGREGRFVAAIGLAYSAYALIGTGSESLAWGLVLVVAGLPVYAWLRWRGRPQSSSSGS